MKRRTGLRRVSKKQAVRLTEYQNKRDEFLRFWTYCEANLEKCWHKATEVHHKKGRLGNNLLETKTWMPVCQVCHTWIEDHKNEARKKGWILY